MVTYLTLVTTCIAINMKPSYISTHLNILFFPLNYIYIYIDDKPYNNYKSRRLSNNVLKTKSTDYQVPGIYVDGLQNFWNLNPAKKRHEFCQNTTKIQIKHKNLEK